MKNILILGGSSLIGLKTAEKFAGKGYCVYAAGRRNAYPESINYINWNIYDAPERSGLNINGSYDCIVVTAWDGNQKDKRNDSKVNMLCAQSLIEWLCFICNECNVKQIILCGSQAEYGNAQGIVTEEYDIDYDTLTSYGRAKLYLYESLKKKNICSVLTELRFHSVYGYSDYKNQMITDIISKGISREDISFYSDCLQKYDFLYNQDAASAIVIAAEKCVNGIFNVSSNECRNLKEYIDITLNIINYPKKPYYGINRSTNDFIFNSDKFRKLTGWQNDFTFETGIRRVIAEINRKNISENDVIIYGAGYCGLMFSDLLDENGIKPICFFDKNENKIGMKFNNIIVKKPEKSDKRNVSVIVCILDYSIYEDIRNYLEQLGFKNIYSIFDFRYDEALFRNQPLIFYTPSDWVEKNRDNINFVYNLFDDELSKSIYHQIISYVSGDMGEKITHLPMNRQYFAYDAYSRIDEEVFLDCGAFRGDILKYFIENNEGRYKGYFAIEPDPDNYSRIEMLPEANDKRVEVIKYAVSDKTEILKMKNYLNENSVVRNDGFEVRALEIDKICGNYGIIPTFIKIDIEGFEEKLLNGAEQTIRRYKPLIAIAIYHKCDDLWKLPLKIKEMLPEHKLYLRSYMNVNETILYAVPRERCVESN